MACCLKVTKPPFTAFEAMTLPAELRESLKVEGDGCTWLDRETKRCKHYEHRPMICENFEVGGLLCLEWRSERVCD